MACLGVSLRDLLPSWLRCFIAIPSRSYARSSRNTSFSKEGDPCGSYRNSIDWTGYVPEEELQCPDPPQAPKQATSEDKYHNWPSFSCNTTRQIQREPTIYPPSLGMHYSFFYFFCTFGFDVLIN